MSSGILVGAERRFDHGIPGNKAVGCERTTDFHLRREMSSYYAGASRTGTFLHKHGLSLALISIFTIQTAISLVYGRQVWLADPVATFWTWWIWEYNTSLVADVFGAILLVILSKRLREVGSAEDSGNDDPEKSNG